MDALSADRLLKRYLARPETREALQADDADIRVLIPPMGSKTVTRLIEIHGATRAVLRFFPRKERGIVRQRELVEKLIVDNDLPIPRLLDVCHRKKEKAIAILEEFVEGNHPSPQTADTAQAAALADAFAAVHRVTSPGFGKPGSVKSKGFRKDALRAVRNRFRSIKRFNAPPFDRSEMKRARQWFRDSSQCLQDIDRFSLIHYKPHDRNLLWNSKTGRFALIDLETMRFGSAAKDLVELQHQILGADPVKCDVLMKSYFEKAGYEFLPNYKAVENFYHAYFHLGRCAINCHSYRRYGETANPFRPEPVKDCLAAWKELMKIVEAS